MRRTPGTEEATQLLIDADDSTGTGGGGSGFGSGGRPPASRLGPGHGAGIAAAILVLLVLGIAAGGLSTTPDQSQSPSGSAAPTPHLSIGPTDDVACEAPRLGQLPSVTLVTPDNGSVGTGILGGGSILGQPDVTVAWHVPHLAMALRVAPGSQVFVVADSPTCLSHLRVDVAATAGMPDGLVIRSFDGSRPPAHAIGIDVPPAGDWVVRVTATFDATGALADAPVVSSITDFRVIVGDGTPTVSDPPPTPVVSRPNRTPDVPCGTLTPTADIPVYLITTNGTTNGTTAAGSATETDAALHEVNVRPGDGAQVVIEGEACATQWQLALFDSSGQNVFDFYLPADDNPAVGAQNRWDIPLKIDGEALLHAHLRFPGGLEIDRYWRIVVDRFTVPFLFLVAADGTRFQATSGCALSVVLSNGYAYQEGCPDLGYTPDADALHVAANSVIHVDLPGWGVTSWNGSCGQMSVDGQSFEVLNGCGLGGGGSDAGSALPARPAFLVPAGDQIVLLDLSAIDTQGNSFQVSYFAHVIAQ